MPPAMAGVTDVHVHCQPFRMLKPEVLEAMKRERGPRFHRLLEMCDDPAVLLDILDGAGVDRACLINYVAPDVMGFLPEVNRWVLDYSRADRKRLIPSGSIHPASSADVGHDARALIAERIGGFKVHPPHQKIFPNDPRLAPLYEAAEAAKVPVMIHSGTSTFPAAKSRFGDPIHVDDIAVDHPELTIILAHGGRPLWCEAAFFLARRHRNVSIDISSIPPKNLLQYFPRIEEMPRKFLFGSDWPGPGVPGIEENVRAVQSLDLTGSTVKRVLYENAARLFRGA